MTSTRIYPKLTAVIENGFHMYAGDGAVAQDGKLAMYTCACNGQTVVWATSRKTGKKYLVNTTRGAAGQRFYMKNMIHKHVN